MPRLRRCAFAATAIAVALGGTWVGHALEYLRTGGAPGLSTALSGSVHDYMLPAAALIAAVAAVAAAWLGRCWGMLGRRIDVLSELVGATARGRHPRARRDGDIAAWQAPMPSFGARLLALWVPLAVLQTSLYLVQENVEAIRAGMAAPGWGAVSGAHWGAAAIQLHVALLGAVLLLVIALPFRRRIARLARIARRLTALLTALGPVREVAPQPPGVQRVPSRWFGGPLRRRPPPSLPARP